MTHTGHIRDILNTKGSVAWTISPDATVFQAIEIMANKNIGALLVTDRTGALVGIITERDYTRKVALKGRSSKETAVQEILSQPVRVTPDNTVEECMKLMTENRVRHLAVVEGQKLAGVVSIGDLVNSIISAQHSTIHQLETYITGFPTPSA